MVDVCRHTGVPCHIVHLSAASALPLIRAARAEGLRLTVETCHHYLHLTSDLIPARATQYKCCPPIRDQENQELLWGAVLAGDIDMIVSDHSPCTPDLKLPGKSPHSHYISYIWLMRMLCVEKLSVSSDLIFFSNKIQVLKEKTFIGKSLD